MNIEEQVAEDVNEDKNKGVFKEIKNDTSPLTVFEFLQPLGGNKNSVWK